MNRTARTLLALLGPVLLAMLGVPALQGTASAAAPPAGQATRYTMTAFTNSSESSMYVYDSPDATGFTLQKGPAYTPPSGLIRDPSIFKHTDGFYYITYTTNWTGNTIGFARSTDRVKGPDLRTALPPFRRGPHPRRHGPDSAPHASSQDIQCLTRLPESGSTPSESIPAFSCRRTGQRQHSRPLIHPMDQ
ncbi:hypothetical protein [Streptomyces sp. NPDC093568]|uniref:hypothetical protein n=1 Tax=Streptomyces sp. NPDC093568 TaxID=3366041 RepID=UPI0038139EA9